MPTKYICTNKNLFKNLSLQKISKDICTNLHQLHHHLHHLYRLKNLKYLHTYKNNINIGQILVIGICNSVQIWRQVGAESWRH